MNIPVLACLLSVFLLTACAGQAIQRKDGSSSVRGCSIRDLAKSDVDIVVEIHRQEDSMTEHSLELEFGKLIGLQDTPAKIIADKNNPATRFSVVNAAGFLFLPI